MQEIGYGAALVLAAVLFVAGVAKLRAPAATAASFRALGLPAASTLSTAVPLAEFAVGAALVVAPRWGAAAALVLLGGFSAVLLRGMQRGIGCGCFGTSATAPVSVADLVRNGLLGAAAAGALWAPQPDALALPAIVLVTTLTILGAVAVALTRLAADAGTLWARPAAQR